MAETPRSILMVEDDPDDIELTRMALHQTFAGWDWRLANDGLAGLELLLDPREKLPDLLLLDINLPRMDGFELLERLRKERGDDLGGLKVAILSSSGEERDMDRAGALGAGLYIRKPVSRVESEEMVKRLAAFVVI